MPCLWRWPPLQKIGENDSGGLMNKTRPTQLKREREKAKRERQQKKAARRAETKAARHDASTGGQTGLERLDQQIAHIIPGPQPPQDEES